MISGTTEVLVFPEAWTVIGPMVRTDIPVLIKGGYSRRDQEADNPTFIVEKITTMAELRTSGQVAIALHIETPAELAPSIFADVKAAIATHATTNTSAPAPSSSATGPASTREAAHNCLSVMASATGFPSASTRPPRSSRSRCGEPDAIAETWGPTTNAASPLAVS